MSFWKFMAPATVDTISSIIDKLPAHDDPSAPLTPADVALYETTLDSLLGTPDLLSEIKSGSNQRLNDFLAYESVVLRLGGWVVWGLGRDRVEEVPNGGIIADDVEDGKVPDFVVAGAEPKKVGMGGVPRRRNMDEMGVLEGGTPETEQEKAWSVFPRLCTEILSSDTPSLTTTLFHHDAASSQPSTCPAPLAFLLPFWETLLGCTEVQLETRAVQVGYWARVNGVLLSGPRGAEVLSLVLTIPHLLPRLLALLPYCSPINDLLLLLLRISTPPSPLIPSVVKQSIRMLDPFAALGKEGHVAAEELLRGIIELCSAAPTPGPPGPGGQDAIEWRDNSLARQIADGRSVRLLVDWMLAGLDGPKAEGRTSVDEEATPRISTVELDTSSAQERAELRTSSLVQSISVLVDLIRKNNSDFVEQQMLSWARRKEEEEAERELLEADGAEIVVDPLSADDGRPKDTDRGPSLVDLGAMLSIVSERIPRLQKLVQTPRSLSGPITTSAGSITPLTLERFRICEFYAELLHCSNMSLLNRPPSSNHLYDAEGYLAQGWRAADDLADALTGPPPEEEEDDRDARLPSTPSGPSDLSLDSTTGPIDVPSSFSGISTPSGQGSLDSESGILTRAEAKELRDVVAAAATEDEESAGMTEEEDEKDPFGDPEGSGSDTDLAEATEAINLDGTVPSEEQDDAKEGTEKEVEKVAEEKAEDDDDVPPPVPPKTPRRSPTLAFHSLPPGPMLKRRFIENQVIETMLQMFFDFPWNNFLHNVVFDILQQIFHGRIDRPLDRQLVLSVFLEGRLIDRILEGQAANDAACSKPNGIRLGYMGHMILIAEEVVKLFGRFPHEIYAVVEPHIPEPAWSNYTETTLRETRERDLLQLGGGITIAPHDTASTTSGLSDEDDEFPMNSQRAMRAMEAGGQAGGGSPTDEGMFGGHAKASTSTERGEPGSSDQFSRYLRNAISSDRPDNFGSSDEDDDDDDDVWGGEPGDGDFALGDSNVAQGKTTFGFDDRFDSMEPAQFRSSSPDDDGDWGPFSADASTSKSSPFSQDDFRPTVASSSFAFQSSFSDNFDASPEAPIGGNDDDDFGDFENAPSITLPSMDALEDFDFGEEARPNLNVPTSFGARPAFGRRVTADDGSALFGGLTSSFDDSDPSSPVIPASSSSNASASPPASPSLQADLATSLAEPLGPSMSKSSHLTDDGFVEAVSEVDGSRIRVPADDIVLAHRRSSLDGAERPTL